MSRLTRGENISSDIGAKMSKIFLIGSASLCVLFGYAFLEIWNTLYSVPPRPKCADESPWWGPGQETHEQVVIKKFTVNISDSVSFNFI